MKYEGYVVEGWAEGSCVGWRSVLQRRAVVSTAEHYLLDRGATIVYVYRAMKKGREAIAQVSPALVWRWQGPIKARWPLYQYLQETERV